MKIGYPCINRSLSTRSNATFRLKSFTQDKFIETVASNLKGLQDILEYNRENGLHFFRISSDLIPFASHPICTIDWQKHFACELKALGEFILKNNFRISMHPSQFVLINALDEKIVKNSIRDLEWHVAFLDAMQLKKDAKVQIHVGGIYGDKIAAIKRFIDVYKTLPSSIQNRLVIENDDRLFDLKDCLTIHEEVGIPIIFDNLHHECLHNNELLKDAIQSAAKTWQEKDGILMADYSSQALNEKVGKHTESLDPQLFADYIKATLECDFDIMLEIKDKEPSALKALEVANKYRRID